MSENDFDDEKTVSEAELTSVNNDDEKAKALERRRRLEDILEERRMRKELDDFDEDYDEDDDIYSRYDDLDSES